MKKRDDSKGDHHLPTPSVTELKTIETEKKSIELNGADDYSHLPYPDDLNKHSKSVI